MKRLLVSLCIIGSLAVYDVSADMVVNDITADLVNSAPGSKSPFAVKDELTNFVVGSNWTDVAHIDMLISTENFPFYPAFSNTINGLTFTGWGNTPNGQFHLTVTGESLPEYIDLGFYIAPQQVDNTAKKPQQQSDIYYIGRLETGNQFDITFNYTVGKKPAGKMYVYYNIPSNVNAVSESNDIPEPAPLALMLGGLLGLGYIRRRAVA